MSKVSINDIINKFGIENISFMVNDVDGATEITWAVNERYKLFGSITKLLVDRIEVNPYDNELRLITVYCDEI